MLRCRKCSVKNDSRFAKIFHYQNIVVMEIKEYCLCHNDIFRFCQSVVIFSGLGQALIKVF